MALTFKETKIFILFSNYEFEVISLKKLSVHLNAYLKKFKS